MSFSGPTSVFPSLPTDSQLSGDFDLDHLQPSPLEPHYGRGRDGQHFSSRHRNRRRSSSYHTFDLVYPPSSSLPAPFKPVPLVDLSPCFFLIVEDIRLSGQPALISLHTNPFSAISLITGPDTTIFVFFCRFVSESKFFLPPLHQQALSEAVLWS